MGHDIEEVLGIAAVRRIRELLEERPDAVVTVSDPSGEIVWASELGSRELFGREVAEVEGRSRFDYVHPHDAASVQRAYEQAVQGETVQYAFRAAVSDGEWKPVSTVAWSVMGPSGPLIVAVTVPQGRA